jgi:hypothetical protein
LFAGLSVRCKDHAWWHLCIGSRTVPAFARWAAAWQPSLGYRELKRSDFRLRVGLSN